MPPKPGTWPMSSMGSAIKIAGYVIGVGVLLCAALFVLFVIFEWFDRDYYPGIATSFQQAVCRSIDCLFDQVIPAFLGLGMLYILQHIFCSG